MNIATPSLFTGRLSNAARAASLGLLLVAGAAAAQPEADQAPAPVTAQETQQVDQQSSAARDQQELEELLRAIGPIIEESSRAPADSAFDTSQLIPLLAILLIFGGPVAVIIVVGTAHYRSKTRRKQLQYETIARLVEAGRDIPPELLAEEDTTPTVRAENNLRKGIKNVSLGVGLFAALSLFFGIDIGALGLIFIALGVGQLVVWKVADNKEPAISPRD